jgi:hypothetical protein
MYLQIPAEERRVVLERAARALGSGGVILVVGHHLRNLTDGWGGPSNAEVLYTPEQVAADLAGLVVDRLGEVSRSVEDEGGPHEAIDALVLARRGDA